MKSLIDFTIRRMRQNVLLLLIPATGFLSCIKDEALNAECDILGVTEEWLTEHSDILVGSPIVTNTSVGFTIKNGTDRTSFAPVFVLTPGAVLTYDKEDVAVEGNGVARDFSSPQIYTVHSEDGNWNKNYSVSFNYPLPITSCDFEYYELDASKRYQVWYEIDPTDTENPRRDYWATGNAGYAFTGMAKSPEDYPTVAVAQGHRNNGVKLETKATGSFGEVVNMPIAAGNMFIGEFISASAVARPRRATRFGLPLVGGKPLYLRGMYKYTAGEVFTDGKKNVCPDRHDTCDIYSVVYEIDPDPKKFVPLNGDDVLTSNRIVAMARIDEPGEPKEWTVFNEPFRMMNGKEFDEERLRNNGYAIAIVATSSRGGAYFEGAIGSVLYIDELRVVWEGEIE